MDDKSRRDFLRSGWKLGGALLIGAAAYTGYEALRRWRPARAAPRSRSARSRASPQDTSTYVPAGRMYVVNANDYLFALSQKCPHLGCHVPYCESSGRFECPCHGSIYDLAGEYIAGPGAAGHGPLRGDARRPERRRRHERPGDRARPRSQDLPHAAQGPGCIGKA